jgi:hypothetical protein
LQRLLQFNLPGIVSLNNKASSDPFTLDSSRSGCDAEIQARLTPMLEVLKAQLTSGSPAFDVPRATVQRSGSSLFLTPLDPYVETDIQVCSAIHLGNVSQAEHMGLAVPPPDPITGASVLGLNAKVGFYEILGAASSESTGGYRLYGIDTPRPSDAFAVERRCPAAMRGTAVTLLDELRNIIAHTTTSSNAAWTAVPSKGGQWIALSPRDPSIAAVMFACAHVTSATATQLQKVGLDGTPLPGFNYAEAIGIYIVR